MQTRELTADEVTLFGKAHDLLERAHHPELHQVAVALQTASGEYYYGLHMGSRRINVCAESSALANAQMAGDTDIVAMVAVCKDDEGRIVVTNPCGVCRELMSSYCLDADVLIDAEGVVRAVSARDLMPSPWMFPRENTWSVVDPRNEEKS